MCQETLGIFGSWEKPPTYMLEEWMDGWKKGWIFQTDSALLPLTLDPRLILDYLDLPWTNYLCILATTLN